MNQPEEIAGLVAGLKQLAKAACAWSSLIGSHERTLHWKAAAALQQQAREIERLKAAAVPICIGPPLIGILAKEGAWQSSTGQCIVAADGLHGSDPYERIDELEAERDAIRAKAIEECLGLVTDASADAIRDHFKLKPSD